jgi:uncharacterized membrane protein YphA (DoxX/SURF4 family)
VRERWSTWQPWVTLVARVGLGLTMMAAGLLKLPDPGEAVRGVRAYRLLPEPVVPAVAFGVPALEVLLGVLLVVGLFSRWAAAAVGAILVVFIAAIASAWARGLSIDCGCFGGGGDIAPGQTRYVEEILRDIGLFLVAALIVRWPWSRFSVDGWLRGSAPDREPAPQG